MGFTTSLARGIALTLVLLAAMPVEAQRVRPTPRPVRPPVPPAPQTPTRPPVQATTIPASTSWHLFPDGMLRIEASCTMAELDEVCKAQAARVTAIGFVANNPNVDSLAPLAQLKGLKSLVMRGREVSLTRPFDLTPLVGLTQLEDVAFYGTKVQSTAPLAELKKLRKLTMQNALDSLDFVKDLANLEELDIQSNNKIKDYTPLLALTHLKCLNIDHNNLQATDAHLAPLAAMTSLEKIFMQDLNASVTTLDFLKGCKGLKEIQAKGCQIKDISALKDMDQLETLTLALDPVSDISALAGKTHLINLRLSHGQVSDLTPLEKCAALNMFTINGTQVKDLSPLAHCLRLDRVVLANSPIQDLTPLANCTDMQSYLDVSGTQVSDLTAVGNLVNLQILNIAKTPVKDLGPVLRCQKLQRLILSDTVPQEQIDNFKKAVPACAVTVQH